MADPARTAADPDRTPSVRVLLEVRDGDPLDLAPDLAAWRGQRGVQVRITVLDSTRAGRVRAPDVTVVRASALAAPRELRRLATSAPDPVALARAGVLPEPDHLRRAVARLQSEPGARVVTCDSWLVDADGEPVDRSSAAGMGDSPGPWFEAGLVATGEAFESMRTAAFFPGVLELWRRIRAEGGAAHVEEPGIRVPARRFEDAWERSRRDGELARLAARGRVDAEPELTVSLCTFDRAEVLLECLESFARQLVPPGTFEIVLVDDGSTDETPELLADLDLVVPTRTVRRANGGLAAARNTGLAFARGRLVLFVNDDTIAAPDLVERHLGAHARIPAGVRRSVLGSFEQPPEALDNALLGYLEGSTEVFGYARLEPGEEYGPFQFWTCNVSVPLADVRAAGGFDPTFRHYGCEDTDLAFRLRALGSRVVYDPRARAIHRHWMDFEYVKRRARTVAAAFVRLARKHPDVLRLWNNESMTRDGLRAELAGSEEALAACEDAAREVASLDLGELERRGGEGAEVARQARLTLERLVPELNRTWWLQGYLEGLEEHGLEGAAELLRDDLPPLGFDPTAGPHALLCPDPDDPRSLDRLLERAEPLAGAPGATLVLCHDASADGPSAGQRERAAAAVERRFGPDAAPRLAWTPAPTDAPTAHRLGRSVAALLPDTGGPGLAESIAAEPLPEAGDVRDWIARYAPPPAREPAAGGPAGPELTVVVPTRDRPELVARLLARLEGQDCDPARFEVVLVDDGSSEPLSLPATALDATLVAQAPTGPAAARNLGVARARGDLVLFLNDDAVPAPGLIGAHLAAHRATDDPCCVLGTFALTPEHRVDALATWIETTTTLFAQPRMKPGVLYHGRALCTGNVSVRRAHLEEVGGFDGEFETAGGEDSELGHRLEAELGVRVRFEPLAACGHDHSIDVRALARRKTVVGRAVHRIQTLHGDLGLAPVPWPPRPEDWERLRAALRREEPEQRRRIDAVDAACRAQRAAGGDDHDPGPLADDLCAIEEHAFVAGLVAAEDALVDAAGT